MVLAFKSEPTKLELALKTLKMNIGKSDPEAFAGLEVSARALKAKKQSTN